MCDGSETPADGYIVCDGPTGKLNESIGITPEYVETAPEFFQQTGNPEHLLHGNGAGFAYNLVGCWFSDLSGAVVFETRESVGERLQQQLRNHAMGRALGLEDSLSAEGVKAMTGKEALEMQHHLAK